MTIDPQKQSLEIITRPIILSLYDWSMSWCRPYSENGYRVLPIDLKWGIDILTWDYKMIPKGLVYGILSAPPCTDFAGSGAQYWRQKDLDGRTEYSLSLVRKVLEVVEYFQPTFWVMENPVGRLNKLLPELEKFGPWYIQPYEFGDPWTKKTGLWGVFNKPIKNKVEPIKYCEQGSYIQLYGGKSEKTKELRSVTPQGFSYAFYEQNNETDSYFIGNSTLKTEKLVNYIEEKNGGAFIVSDIKSKKIQINKERITGMSGF